MITLMKLGIVIYSNDAETVWNAFRLASIAVKKGDSVKVFLLGKGVECESIDTEKFDVKNQAQSFLDAGGQILACTTCLKLRQQDATAVCPYNSITDLYTIIAESDKLLTF